MEPIEPPIHLPKGGAWPNSLIDLTLPDALDAEAAACEVAGASRRLRQGVRGVLRGYMMVGYPNESVADIRRRWQGMVTDVRMATRFPEPLPQAGLDIRWTADRKIRLLVAIGSGLITPAQAMERYGLDALELREWGTRFDHFGRDGLRAYKVQEFRMVGPGVGEPDLDAPAMDPTAVALPVGPTPAQAGARGS